MREKVTALELSVSNGSEEKVQYEVNAFFIFIYESVIFI